MKPFNEADFKTVKKVSELPAGVRHALKDCPMSDDGGPFNAGCVVDPRENVPSSRLIFGAFSKDKCIVHYEQGGIAHFYKVACYDLRDANGKEKDSAPLLWSTILMGSGRIEGLSNLADLNKVIEKGELQVHPPAEN